MSDKTRDMECPNCGRTVVEAVNYHSSLGTCVFCDLNREGIDAGGCEVEL